MSTPTIAVKESLDDLKGIGPSTGISGFKLVYVIGKGLYQYKTGDQSSNVPSGNDGDVWVAPAEDTSGKSGAWQLDGSGILDPEHATDSGTDTYVSATNTTVPGDGVTITRDFQSANTTTTPTLDGKTMTTRDGSALWAGAVSGPHDVQYALGTDTYLVLEPNPSQQIDPIQPRVRAVGVLARHQNLVVQNNSSNPNKQVDIDADELEVYDANGIPRVLTGVNLTVDITASGANGLDTGAEAEATWYHLWVIYNGTTVAGLLSTSSTFSGLTLPSGYTYAGYVGAIRNDASSNLHVTNQVGNEAVWDGWDTAALSTGTGGTGTSINISSFVPQTAKAVFGTLQGGANAGSNADGEVTSTGTREGRIRYRHLEDALAHSGYFPFRLTLVESQTMYYGVGSGDLTILISGWSF